MISLLKKIYSGAYNTRLFVVAVSLFGVYSFFIVSTVMAVNQRKDIRTNIRSAQAQVSDLEISYFNLASQVDVKKAEALGFINAPVPKFAYTNAQPEKVALVR